MAVVVAAVILWLVGAYSATAAGVAFSSLQETLIVTASPRPGQVLKSGEDEINVTWSVNTSSSFPDGIDSAYKTVTVKLCYAPVSQKDRGWRKTVDNLNKDKTCQHHLLSRSYANTFTTTATLLPKDVPTATYFIRAYAYNSAAQEVAYGQTTDSHKATNLFQVHAASGRDLSLDIASICFSAFSIISLFGFLFIEKRRSKASQPN